MLERSCRNGNVHTLSYDVLGRLVSNAVTTLGSGVDGAVRRIEYAYDGQGNAYLVTSYDAASAGNIVNQIQREFNGLGQMMKEWLQHSDHPHFATAFRLRHLPRRETGLSSLGDMRSYYGVRLGGSNCPAGAGLLW